MADCLNHGIIVNRLENLEGIVSNFNSNQQDVIKSHAELRERVVLLESSHKSAHYRIDEMKDQTEAIIRMSMSVESMSGKMKDIIDLYGKQDERIDKLEKSPGDNLLNYTRVFVGAVVTSVAILMFNMISK